MFHKIFNQVAALLALLTSTVVVILVWQLLATQQEIGWETAQRMHQHLAGHILHESPLLPDNLLDGDAIKHAFHLMMVMGPNLELYILDQQGEILNHAAPPENIKRQRVDIIPIKRFIAGEQNYPILGMDPRSTHDKKPFSAATISKDGQLIGYLYIIVGSQVQDNISEMITSRNYIKYGLIPVALILVCSLLMAWIMFVRVTQPLNRLAFQLRKMEPNRMDNSSNRMPVINAKDAERKDEIGELNRGIQRFLAKINMQYLQLMENKEAQRLLFNQIAHDFRTPLTNALLAVENAERHQDVQANGSLQHSLAIVHKNCDKITNFINEMLDLARLESGHTKLQKEPFPLIELVHDSLQDFQYAVQQRSITVKLNEAGSNQLVNIDVSYLGRVINNLISNGIRHAAKNTILDLRVTTDEAFMSFEIKNQGPSIDSRVIANMESPKAFALASKAGYGLGLAICHRILKLHASCLKIDNNNGEGARFAFELPLVKAV